ncbi:MAG: SDR family oxidoreductase [Gammaproteobacteria bacterium]
MLRNHTIQPKEVGLIGATGLVGDYLLTLLTQAEWKVIAHYRKKPGRSLEGVEWRPLPEPDSADFEAPGPQTVKYWICTAPIYALPAYFGFLKAHNAQRIIALSSTSRFTKGDSSDPNEQALARRLAEGEKSLEAWGNANAAEWVILRPTLIYGMGRDKNIAEITRFIRRFGFFPLFGQARGLRQPIRLHDVAHTCIRALQSPEAANHAYNISGGETLTYRDMVCRIFLAMGHTPRFLPVPLFFFRMAIACLRMLPRYRNWSPAMAERMNRDMAFDHSEAARDLAFEPGTFELSSEEVA